jgi:transcriptional regulator with XRE-family HTH domain
MEQETWSTKCRTWREGLGLVAKEAAEKLGVPFDTYRGWEKGLVPAKFTRGAIVLLMRRAESGN